MRLKSFHQHGRLLLAALLPLIGAAWAVAGPAAGGRKEWVAPRRHARKKNKVPADGASLERGRRLFVKNCLSCHGTQGAGDGPAASGLDVHPGNLTDAKKMNAQKDGEIYFKVRTGRRPMPAFRETLKSNEIWDVVNYVRTLAGRKVTAKEAWFEGAAPRLPEALGAEVGSAEADLLARYEALREAIRSGDAGASAEAESVRKELARLAALEGPASFGTEMQALAKLLSPHLDEIGKAAGEAGVKHLSEISSRLAEFLGRYPASLPETWTLYLYEAKGGNGTLYWLQKGDEPANPYARSGGEGRATAATTFGTVPDAQASD